jgi:hypothetical protein
MFPHSVNLHSHNKVMQCEGRLIGGSVCVEREREKEREREREREREKGNAACAIGGIRF